MLCKRVYIFGLLFAVTRTDNTAHGHEIESDEQTLDDGKIIIPAGRSIKPRKVDAPPPRNNKFKGRAAIAPSCASIVFRDITLSPSGLTVKGHLSTESVNMTWYDAICCCRSRGYHLARLTTPDEGTELWSKTSNGDYIGWVDANSIATAGEFKTFKGEISIPFEIFHLGIQPEPQNNWCGTAHSYQNTYFMQTQDCNTRLNKRLICLESDSTLPDNCFSNGVEETDVFKGCQRATLDEFITTRTCPRFPVPDFGVNSNDPGYGGGQIGCEGGGCGNGPIVAQASVGYGLWGGSGGCGGCAGSSGPGCAGCGGGNDKSGSTGGLAFGKPEFPYSSFDEHFHNAPANLFNFFGRGR